MPICVISTVGTSVFSNAHQNLKDEWKTFSKTNTANLDAIRGADQFEGFDLYQRSLNYLEAEAKSENTLSKASAELNSLTRIIKRSEVTNSDQLYFLATDTADGVLAARIIKDFSQDFFNIKNSEVRLIKGLQVNDGERFQKDGVRNLISNIYTILKGAPDGTYKRILNPTGGFKGVVPYLTLIGMIEPNIELSYIYERSDSLISLGHIPLQLNFEALSDAHQALKGCSEDYITEDQLRELLHINSEMPLTQHPAWSLFDQIEQDDIRRFGVNGLGTIVLEHLEVREQTKIYLSEKAAQRYDGLDNTKRKVFDKYFKQLRNPEWIDAKRHDEYKNTGEAIAIKPGNVDERMFIYKLDDGSILVAELAFHLTNGSYDREPKRRKDYSTYRLWEG